mmetsp:Transcript_149829/g.481315  ORF Transcript_149829/g.481315 Transcript_149829/m.481315 type:complete len:263 (+) Transcript_149829:2052-2840(+)
MVVLRRVRKVGRRELDFLEGLLRCEPELLTSLVEHPQGRSVTSPPEVQLVAAHGACGVEQLGSLCRILFLVSRLLPLLLLRFRWVLLDVRLLHLAILLPRRNGHAACGATAAVLALEALQRGGVAAEEPQQAPQAWLSERVAVEQQLLQAPVLRECVLEDERPQVVDQVGRDVKKLQGAVPRQLFQQRRDRSFAFLCPRAAAVRHGQRVQDLALAHACSQKSKGRMVKYVPAQVQLLHHSGTQQWRQAQRGGASTKGQAAIG